MNLKEYKPYVLLKFFKSNNISLFGFKNVEDNFFRLIHEFFKKLYKTIIRKINII